MNNSSGINSSGSTSILALPTKEPQDKRAEDSRAEDSRAVDSRIEAVDRFDLETELSNLAIAIKTAEKSICELDRKKRELDRKKTKFDQVKEDAESKLLEMMLEWDLPEYFIRDYRLSLEKSIYVSVTNEDLVPEKFRRYKFSVNKKLIHKLCKRGKKILRRTPPGTAFKKRNTVSITKY